jgi:hypothetical protein
MTQQPPTDADAIEKAIAYGVGIVGLLAGGWKIVEGWFDQRRKNKESDVATLKGVLDLAKEFTNREDDERLTQALDTIATLYAKIEKKDELLTAAQEGRHHAESMIAELRRDVDDRDVVVKQLKEQVTELTQVNAILDARIKRLEES